MNPVRGLSVTVFIPPFPEPSPTELGEWTLLCLSRGVKYPAVERRDLYKKQHLLKKSALIKKEEINFFSFMKMKAKNIFFPIIGAIFFVFFFQINLVAATIILSNVRAEEITANSAKIRWTTDKPTNISILYFWGSKVWYDTTSGQYGYESTNRCDAGGDSITDHCIALTNLNANTTYYYRAYAVDGPTREDGMASGQFTATITSGTVVAPPPPPATDIQAPTSPNTISVGKLYEAGVASSTALSISWSGATDNIAVVGYKIFRNGNFVTSVTTQNYTDTGLSPGTTYQYYVKSYDAAGNESAISGTVSGDTAGGTVPTAASALSASASGSNVSLIWVDNSTNETFFYVGKRVSGGTWDMTVSVGANTTSHTFSNLPVATYDFKITVCNTVGCGSDSNIVTIAVGSTDTTAPSVPTGLTATVYSSSQIDLSWTASTDNVAVTGYEIYRNSSLLTTSSMTSYSDTVLSPSTSYSYYVKVYDAAGNKSAASASVSATTLSSATPPPPPPPPPPPSSTTATAPPFAWARLVGGSSTEYGRGVHFDSYSGYIYFVGDTGSSLNSYTAQGFQDSFISKYDNSGNRIWLRVLGSSGSDIFTSVSGERTGDVYVSGNVYAAGGTYGNLDGNTNFGSEDATLVKYDPSGVKVWTRTLGTSGLDRAEAVAVDDSGNIYIAGLIGGSFDGQSYVGSNDAFIAKYSSSGTRLWTRIFGTSGLDKVSAIKTDSSGNVYVTGLISGSFGGQTFAGGSYDAYVAKYDSGGNRLWVRFVGSSSTDIAEGVAVDTSNNVYLIGYTSASIDGQTYSGQWDVFVTKFDSAGTKLWTRLYGDVDNELTHGGSVDSGGNLIIYGYHIGSAFYENSNLGSADVFLLKIDSSGNRVWSSVLGSSNEENALGAPVIDGSGNIYVAGMTYGSLGSQTNNGGVDAFIAKFGSAGTAVSTTDTGAPSVPTGLTATAFSSSQINLSWAFSTDNVGVAGYKIFKLGAYKTSVSILSYSDIGLAADIEYCYELKAYDAAGNESGLSSSVCAKTLAATTTDSTAPVISGARADNISGSGAQIKWTTDDVSDSRVYWGTASTSLGNFSDSRCDNGGNVTDHCVNISGLSLSTTYFYKAYSKNAVNLESNSSVYSFTSASTTTVVITTPPPPPPPPPTPTLTIDTVPPAISQFGYAVQPDGRVRAGVIFSEPVNQDTLTSDNVYVIKPSDGSKIPGIITKYFIENGVDYFTSSPITPAVDYQLVVKKEVKDISGNNLAQDYLSPRFQLSTTTPTTYVTPAVVPFAVDPALTTPRPGEIGIDVNVWIRVKFTKEFDKDSTANQFFTLTTLLNPNLVIGGSFRIFSDGFEFIPQTALQPNTIYVYNVLPTLKDLTGAPLSSVYSAKFTTGGAFQAGGTIEGTVVNGNGEPVTNTGIHIYNVDFTLNFGGPTDNRGAFRFDIPVGTYFIEVFPPPDKTDLIRPAPEKFILGVGEKKIFSLRLAASTKIVTGQVLFSDDQPVTDAEVGAYSTESGQWVSAFTDTLGKYILRVGGGRFHIGVRPKDSQIAKWVFAGVLAEVDFARDVKPETRFVNLIVPALDSTLVVKVADDAGNALVGAGVVVDTTGALELTPTTRQPQQFKTSDSSGIARFSLRAATYYYVRAYLPPDKGFSNPEEKRIAISSSGKTEEITIIFRKRTEVSTVTLSGTTKLEDGTPVSAFVWAWSEKGRFIDTLSSDDGFFKLQVALNDRWHLGAGKEVRGEHNKASEVVVPVFQDPVSAELVLVRLKEKLLPPAVAIRHEAAEQVVAQVKDGARVVLPPKAVADSGTINVEIRPTVDAPSQAGAKVLGTAYDVTVRDQLGKEVKALRQEVEVVLPYDEVELKAQNVGEDAIIPSFFDEKTNTWVRVDNYTIDKTKNVVIVRIRHLTRFAIVAAADVTPPQAPIKIIVIALGAGKMKLTWKNPFGDFAHAKIYRSEKRGELGFIVAPEVIAEEFIDHKNTVDGTFYYYTVRAVDPAGNESNNQDQTIVRAVGSSAPELKPTFILGLKPKTEIVRTLIKGSSGDDVATLQDFLIKQGLLPAYAATGTFDDATRQAVIRFQEKYFDEVLRPVGLTNGSGIVGPATIKKINELLGITKKEAPVLPPGQITKLNILRALRVGTSGDDIKTLQELLVKEGVYPEGLITGFFGNLTKQAVIRFQEKYRDEILIPAGLTQGSGFVGEMTRKKINQLLAK